MITAPGWVAGSSWPAETVVALNSLQLQTSAEVKGDVAVITASSGPWLGGTYEAQIGTNAEVRGNLRADSLRLMSGGHIFGTAAYNGITSNGVIDGAVTTSLALPLAITVPTIPDFNAGTTSIDLAASGTQTLAAGSYGAVILRAGTSLNKTTITLSGGVYTMQSLDLNDHSRVQCAAACEIRIKGRLGAGAHTYLGPSGMSGLVMSAVQVVVEGSNGGTGSADATPYAAAVGDSSELKGNIFVPNGTLQLRSDSSSVGKFVAKDILLGDDAEVQDGTGIVVLPDSWVTGPTWPNEAITALNSVDLNSDVQIAGDLAVIQAATSAVLVSGYEVGIGTDATVTGNVRGDTVLMRTGSHVTGVVAANSLTNNGAAPTGGFVTPLAMPLDVTVPSFPSFTAGTTTVDVPAKADQTLAQGAYGLVKLRAGVANDKTILTLTGGIYTIADVDLGDHSRIECAAACELRIKNRVAPGTNSYFGPSASSGLDISDVRAMVEAKNAGNGGPSATPYSVVFGADSTVKAFIFAPNGTLQIRSGSTAQGRFVAHDIVIGTGGSTEQGGTTISPPVIHQQPSSVTVLDDQPASFGVVAVGTDITFQWQRNGVAIGGATSGNYTLNPATLADNGASFRVVISNVAGTVTSSAATLTVIPAPPAITTHPSDTAATEGQSATFVCAASGTSPSYRWQKDGSDIPGATAASYTIASVAIGHAGAYRCIATNSAGTATSNAATLTVNLIAPAITTQPAAQAALENTTATYSVVATGTNRSYQWRKNGVDIGGATSASYTTPPVVFEDDDGAQLSVVVTNTGGSVTSSNAVLTVNLIAPAITAQPADRTALEGQTTTFAVSATGTNRTYQWRKNGADIPGATASAYTTPQVSFADHGAQFSVVVTNSGGSVTSAAATLSVALLAPTITTQPSAQAATEGQTATFSVVATGTNRTYQWRKNGVSIGGATAASYTTPALSFDDHGAQFSVVVTNTGGSVTSDPATLTVDLVAPAITTQPSDQAATEGQSATFTVVATGTNRSYQWRKDGVAISGAINASYTTPALAFADDQAKFSVVITNTGGSVTSSDATLTVNLIAPTISSQPSDQNAIEGQSATFSVVATGTNRTYQWIRDGADIPGATAASYTTPPVAFADDGAHFRVRVTNSGGNVLSSTADLFVHLIAPTITTQPSNQAATEGQSATFTVSATGTNRTYQWKKNGALLSGATGASYTTPAVELADDGAQYMVVATNSGGSVASNAATLSVNLIAPTITTQPSNKTATEGQSATFTVVATGTNRTYQWRKGGGDIPGATSASYTTPAVSFDDDGSQYDVVVTNSGGSVTSTAAALTVELIAPAISAQPSDQTATEGQSATFTVSATGTNRSYQWRKDGIAISGATNASYTTPAVAFADDGAVFSVVVTNSGGTVTSSGATLHVALIAPAITAAPSNQTATEGQSATFTVAATGTNRTYQWKRNGVAISGAAAASYTTPPVVFADNGDQFSVVVSNSGGSVASAAATLTVALIAPTITAQPSNQTATEGQGATFTVTATGTNRSYQWKKNGLDIAGAVAASYTTPPVSYADHGKLFSVVVTNSGGSVTSSEATLSVDLIAPAITTQPQNVSVSEGQPATFTVEATGTNVSYQWRKNNVAIAAATAATFTIDPAFYGDQGDYDVVVTNTGGSATSQLASLAVSLYAPVITEQPSAQTVTERGTTFFSCEASGTLVSYQWQKDGIDIAGATGSSLTLASVQYTDAGNYRCVANNLGGTATSDAVALTVLLIPPAITAEPADLAVTENEAASFSCAASGTTVSYRWQKGGLDIAGATAATFTLTHAVYTDAGSYRCVATNTGGSATSAAATLTVNLIAAAITTDPISVTVTERESASFTCAASGTLVSYQWQKDGADVAGATSATFLIASAAYGDAGAYRCVATNTAGSATSSSATLTVDLIAPSITTDPSSLTVTEGQPATFSCAATGTLVAYRWQKNGVDIAGANAATFTISDTVYTDAGTYRCIATNSGGSDTSAAAALTILLNAPAITTNPSSLTVTEQDAASFTCAASGTLVTYRWQKEGVDIAGADSATFSIAHVEYTDAGAYRCVATNSAGNATSTAATLAVNLIPPAITTNPSDRTVTEHQPATFTCAASGTLVGYQWQKDGVDVVGATNATFTIAFVQYTDAGGYRCVATNAGGSATSNAATLTVNLIAPVVTSDPVAVTVTEHQPATFTCVASGTLVAYRWQKNGVDVPGATGATYALAQAEYGDAGNYRCVATNTGGSATSNAAGLTVTLIPPAITTQPTNLTVTEGQPAAFHCAASGTLVSYQWRKDSADIANATSGDLAIAATTYLDAGQYSCVAHNFGGDAVSNAATLTVNLIPPQITGQPVDTTVTEGQTLTLHCDASGTLVTYKWQHAGADVANATAKTLGIPNVHYTDAGAYRCAAHNSAGDATSNDATVTVILNPPVIQTQPLDINTVEGQPFTLVATANGSLLQYQWERYGSAIPGATASTYTKTAALSDNGSTYRVIVSNTGGSDASRTATVHVVDTRAPTLTVNNGTSVAVTNDNKIEISGVATDSGAGVQSVTVENNRVPGTTTVGIDGTGSWLGNVPLELGSNTLTITAVDAQGNQTSQTITVVVTAPLIPRVFISSPADGANVTSDRTTVTGFVRSSQRADDIQLSLQDKRANLSGAGPDFPFTFTQVALEAGLNVLTVVAQTPQGNSTSSVRVTNGNAVGSATGLAPVIELQAATPDVYLQTDNIQVAGTVRASRCVQSILVNGHAARVSGTGTSVTFTDTLTFSGAGQDDLVVEVVALDCDGLSSRASYTAHKDDGAPNVSITGLALTPAINSVATTPYRLTGTVSDSRLAGVTVGGQSVPVLPTGTADHWSFAVDVPVVRNVDATVAVEAWDHAGNSTAKTVVLRLDTAFDVEIVAPRDGTRLVSHGGATAVDVLARATGIASSDVITASIDSGTAVALARAGDTASGTISVPTTTGSHTVSVFVKDASGVLLASGVSNVAFVDDDSVALQIVRQTPENASVDIEANAPITLYFNKPIDPSKLTFSVVETAHSKLFVPPGDGADLLSLSNISLVDVDREREPVPGNAQNLPGNTMAVFYPSRDYAYSGTVYVDVDYDGASLEHARFQVRALPPLLHGFVADQMATAIEGIEVYLPARGATAVTNQDGNYSFNFGASPDQIIPVGRYLAVINPGNKNPSFGSYERYLTFDPGLVAAGVTSIPLMNPGEPYRHVQSGQAAAAAFLAGGLRLDVSHATLLFENGTNAGDIHVDFVSRENLSYRAPRSAFPEWLYVVNPIHVAVSGEIGVDMALPQQGNAYTYVDRLPEYVALVGLEPSSLELRVVGVGKVDRAALRVVSQGHVGLERLDAIGISTQVQLQPAMADYAAGNIDLTLLRAALEAHAE